MMIAFAEWKRLSNQGMRLVKIQAFPSSETYHLAGLFDAGPGNHAFLDTLDSARLRGYRLQKTIRYNS
jgi:hypothetical protein